MKAAEFNQAFATTIKWVNVHKDFEEVQVHVKYVIDNYADEKPFYCEVEVHNENGEIEKFQNLFFESESKAKAHATSYKVAEMFAKKVGAENVIWYKEVLK